MPVVWRLVAVWPAFKASEMNFSRDSLYDTVCAFSQLSVAGALEVARVVLVFLLYP